MTELDGAFWRKQKEVWDLMKDGSNGLCCEPNGSNSPSLSMAVVQQKLYRHEVYATSS